MTQDQKKMIADITQRVLSKSTEVLDKMVFDGDIAGYSVENNNNRQNIYVMFPFNVDNISIHIS